MIFQAEVTDDSRKIRVYIICSNVAFKKCCYNNISSLNIQIHRYCTLEHVGGEDRDRKTVGISCGLHQKLAIVARPDRTELLNEQSEIMSKCRHISNYILGLSEPVRT